MAIDKKILKEFQDAMRQLRQGLSASENYAVVEAKVLDYISKNPRVDLRELKRELAQILPQEFQKWINKAVSRYNDTIEVVNNLYSNIAGDLRRDLPRLAQIEQINKTVLGQYTEAVAKEIQQAVRLNIQGNKGYDALVKSLNKLGGKVSGYSQTIAGTQLNGYARAGKNVKANLAEVFYYQYVGSLRKLSRQFCQDTVGQTYHINQINKLTEKDVGSAYIKPCIVYCGGWNCVHDWEPDPFYKQ